MSDQPEQRNGAVNPSVKYEPTDLSLRAVLTFSLTLAGVLAVVAVGLWFLIPALLGPTRPQAPQQPWSFESEGKPDASHLSPPPELEAVERTAAETRGGPPAVSIQKQIENEENTLKADLGVDAQTGTIHIPIEDAMKLLVQQQGRKP